MLFKFFLFIFCMGSFPFLLFSKTEISFEELVGIINFSKDDRFINLDKTNLQVNKPNMYLHKETAKSLEEASVAFVKTFPDIGFVVLSAGRSFSYQNNLWKNKYNKVSNKNIMAYLAIPGLSRHHWGTDVDLISISSRFFNTPKGKKVYLWMQKELPKYGFFQCYKGNTGSKGYSKEEWHWSYMPLASEYLKEYQTILQNDPNKLIEFIKKIKFFKNIPNKKVKNIVEEYLFSIDKGCLV